MMAHEKRIKDCIFQSLSVESSIEVEVKTESVLGDMSIEQETCSPIFRANQGRSNEIYSVTLGFNLGSLKTCST